MATSIDITSDFNAPWCWIGHHHLKQALARTGHQADLRFLPFELHADLPPGGMSRHDYRSAQFGNWARSQSMDEDVTEAGKLIGLHFHYDRIDWTPNTRLAHKLIAYAQQQGDSPRSERLFDAVFKAYFSHGLNIGKARVLADLAAAQGYDAEAALSYLYSQTADTLLAAALDCTASSGINSVPDLLIGPHRVSGAQTAESLAAILRELDQHE
jgi:predicted DsbA family dithiol-disulfide isomerase